MDLKTILSIIVTLGGFEGFKWAINTWRNRKTDARISETKADSDEFHLLRERLELSDKQLLDKEQRFHEQTQLVRDLNKQLLDKTIENGQLQARISTLEAERAMKLCERRGCIDRQPQSGY